MLLLTINFYEKLQSCQCCTDLVSHLLSIFPNHDMKQLPVSFVWLLGQVSVSKVCLLICIYPGLLCWKTFGFVKVQKIKSNFKAPLYKPLVHVWTWSSLFEPSHLQQEVQYVTFVLPPIETQNGSQSLTQDLSRLHCAYPLMLSTL